MKIVINNKNEILSYCILGGLPNSIETQKEFPSQFETQKFIYDKDNDEILNNPNYIENRQEIETEIESFKKMLNDTDYKAIKYAEGIIPEEEYKEIREQRQLWRNEINKLEEIIR